MKLLLAGLLILTLAFLGVACSIPDTPQPSPTVVSTNSTYNLRVEFFNCQQQLYSANSTIANLQSKIKQLESRPPERVDNSQIAEVLGITLEQAQVARQERDMAVASMAQAESNYKLMLDKYNGLRAALEDISAQTDNATSANFTASELSVIYEWWGIRWETLEGR